MGLLFLSKSRGIGNLFSRIGTIISRFGLTPGKFEKLLLKFSAVTHDLGCVPTFPITAKILERNPRMIQILSRNGVEFAIHGYIHADYQTVSAGEQVKHYQKAIDVFNACRVPYTGFRAPFLRTGPATAQVLNRLEFAYDSSQAVNWNVLDRNQYSDASWSEYERVLDFYQSRPAEDIPVLPGLNHGIIEIPVCIPDDEVMVERLGIRDAGEIGRIWEAMLQKVYERGELFTLQLHPERILVCETALAGVLKRARSLNPPVWIATLRQIAGWWQEKAGFSFELEARGDTEFKVHADCTDRATVLVKNCAVRAPANKWLDGYQNVNSRDFIVESPVRPVIGIEGDISPEAMDFLNSEGYITEKSERPERYGVYLSGLARFDEADKRPLLEKIKRSGAPLIRYWRWPDRAKAALTVTGDIDSITLMDFALRVYENWRQQRQRLEDTLH